MVEEIIRTGVDRLLEFLKGIDKIPLTEAAQKLRISSSLLQSWVDFLVEEEIVGIEYKFTKPIIYINRPPEERKVRVEEEAKPGLNVYKEDFVVRASQKNIPQGKITFLWKNHVKVALNRKREFFLREAKKRNLVHIEELWNTYAGRLLLS